MLIRTLKLPRIVANVLERKTVSQVTTYSTNERERERERDWPGGY